MLGKSRAIIGGLIAAVVLLLGGALALWLYNSRIAAVMKQASAASRRQDWTQAQSQYDTVVKRFQASPWLERVLVKDYYDALIGDAAALYAAGKYDDALSVLNREAERSPEFAGDSRRLFWSGNLWFRKAVLEQKDSDRRDRLNAAVDFFRKGLEVAPDRWDMKFNYELTSIILAQENPIKREKREEQQKRRLLPRIRTDQERQRRILPPEERG